MAIVQLDKILSGVSGNLEHVVVYENIENKTHLDKYTNGTFVKAVSLEEGEREAKSAKLAGATDTDVLMVHVPEMQYDEKAYLRDFKISGGTVARAYRMSLGDIVTFTTDILPSGVKVGDKLTVEGGKLVVSADTTDATLAFEVIENSGNELDSIEKAFAIQVIKA